MRTLIVTSRTTFVPGNYDDMIIGLATCPQVHGLVVLDNRSAALVKNALALLAVGARGLGLSLLRNTFGFSHRRRLEAYRQAGKKVWTMTDFNSQEAVSLVKAQAIDLIVNARTRCIYQEGILGAPRLGCINVHHGLLPDQRGTMCDLWALAEGEGAGFSLHQMTAKIDAGQILKTVQVSHPGDSDYLAYLRRAMALELAATQQLLADLGSGGTVAGFANRPTMRRPHRRNPSAAAFRHMLKQGMIL
ncbi:MAG: formyltransferase family protein [Proteobacteria bacterium]|nr:formyltransferase family protein [Pseudomonadota bacterium]